MENKELTTIDYRNAEVIKTLKQTVAIGATDAEFAMFAEQCKSTGLNPFKREVWFIKAAGRVQIMTGIQGFFAIANSTPEFDGYESGLIDKDGNLVSAAYPKEDYIGAWCRVHRKDRKVPTEGIAMLSEYNKGHGNWKTMRRVMITKCAESIALRKSFPQQLNGLYTAEEMRADYSKSGNDNEGGSTPPAVTVQAEIVSTTATQPESDVWTGDFPLGFGKHKDTNWCDVNQNYLEWLHQNTKGEKAINAGLELARRENAPDFEDINEQAQQALNIDTDEIPY